MHYDVSSVQEAGSRLRARGSPKRQDRYQLQLALAWSIARWLRGESLPGEGGCDLRMESIEEKVG